MFENIGNLVSDPRVVETRHWLTEIVAANALPIKLLRRKAGEWQEELVISLEDSGGTPKEAGFIVVSQEWENAKSDERIVTFSCKVGKLGELTYFDSKGNSVSERDTLEYKQVADVDVHSKLRDIENLVREFLPRV